MKDCRGISMVELLIGISVTAVGGLLLMGLLTSSSSIFIDQTVRVNQGVSLNQANLEITDLIKSSSGVATQYPPSGTLQYTTGANVLVLKLAAISSSGQIIDSVFDYAVIFKDPASPKILREKIFVDNQSRRKTVNKVLATALSSINFTYLDSSNAQVPSSQAARINFTINLADKGALTNKESSSSGSVNIKNFN